MASELFVKQNAESEDVTIACRLMPDGDRQVTLIPDQWVKVATCTPGNHVLRVGAILASSSKEVVLSLRGGTFNGDDKIEEEYYSPTDGGRYEIEVQ